MSLYSVVPGPETDFGGGGEKKKNGSERRI